MARKPNYDFERKERDRLKAEKKAKRAAEKKGAREEKSPQSESPEQGGGQAPGSTPTE
ncbi:MAG: hypothetical protein ACFB13_09790 [Kiloniellaceae bacterium]